jgi:indolepyruvate ferredoxin oxidoreductase
MTEVTITPRVGVTPSASPAPGGRGRAGYALDDRYRNDVGTVLMSGVQALARIPLEQLRVDRSNGLRTAAFVSGYPGSPLAGFDKEAARVAAMAVADGMHFVAQPGLNEELAATAVMGSQLALEIDASHATCDGVVGVWYAKAPGLDRACDAIRHAVFAGTHPRGGVVALIGDDPGAKSSTLPSSSDATLVDLHMPLLYPGDIQDALDLGRHAIALSRASGLWSGLKIVAGVADGTGTVNLDLYRVKPVAPTVMVNGTPFVPHPSGRLLTPATLELEREFQDVRLEVARHYALLNNLNTIVVDPSDAWIGIAACGYTYRQLREALRVLGLPDGAAIERAGIRLLNLRMPLPFDPSIVRTFARGLREILVVEEKNPTLEWLIKDALYGGPDQPRVVGKRDEFGAVLMPATGHLDTDAIVAPLRRRLAHVLEERLAPLPPKGRALIPLVVNRTPYFCSGCPHNWGTKVPDGALVGAGIGCHGMTTLMPEDRVGRLGGLSAMGNEGAQWIGMAPFVDEPHFIQNLGDGTYFHSGQLAVRFAIAANVNITYKILYNGTVAMTGGQHAEGSVDVATLAQLLLLEGVKRVVITTDEPKKYARGSLRARAQKRQALPKGVDMRDRTDIVAVQQELAQVRGVTVLIHDQACAAEKRRLRKRGSVPTPAARVVINERVCEGCGDCGDVSNCLSVQPVDTPYGRKTRIHQTSCNLDYSCIKGDCPSFATVTPAANKTSQPVTRSTLAAVDVHVDVHVDVQDLPAPKLLVSADDCTIRMPGIGGTGVVTVSQVVATAALLEGKSARGLDQTGLSQKAGPVVSDIRIATVAHHSNKATDGSIDCYLAFDLLVAASDANLAGCSPERTVVVGSTSPTPTGAMVTHPEIGYPATAELQARINEATRVGDGTWVDAAGLTEDLFGDATTLNIFLLGVGQQAGAVPLQANKIEEAIGLNGVAVERNIAAFRWGRRWVADPHSVRRAATEAAAARHPVAVHGQRQQDQLSLPPALADAIALLPVGDAVRALIGQRSADLVDFQSEKYATRYLDVVARVAVASARCAAGSDRLTEAVARNLAKLMAYKDEYEVARLLVSPQAQIDAEAVGGPGAKVVWHLHPPILRSLGMKSKLKLGPWARPAIAGLAAGKRLRGTPLDPFGYASVRRLERAMVTEYIDAVRALSELLDTTRFDAAVAIAELPDQVRGYEGLKERRAAAYRSELAQRLADYRR